MFDNSLSSRKCCLGCASFTPWYKSVVNSVLLVGTFLTSSTRLIYVSAYSSYTCSWTNTMWVNDAFHGVQFNSLAMLLLSWFCSEITLSINLTLSCPVKFQFWPFRYEWLTLLSFSNVTGSAVRCFEILDWWVQLRWPCHRWSWQTYPAHHPESFLPFYRHHRTGPQILT